MDRLVDLQPIQQHQGFARIAAPHSKRGRFVGRHHSGGAGEGALDVVPQPRLSLKILVRQGAARLGLIPAGRRRPRLDLDALPQGGDQGQVEENLGDSPRQDRDVREALPRQSRRLHFQRVPARRNLQKPEGAVLARRAAHLRPRHENLRFPDGPSISLRPDDAGDAAWRRGRISGRHDEDRPAGTVGRGKPEGRQKTLENDARFSRLRLRSDDHFRSNEIAAVDEVKAPGSQVFKGFREGPLRVPRRLRGSGPREGAASGEHGDPDRQKQPPGGQGAIRIVDP
jgi:hypothetical protein